MQHHRFSAPVSNSWVAPPAADDPLLLPEVLHSPRLRSVSSLVLSCDIDDGLSHVPSRARRQRELQQLQQRQRQPAAEADAAVAYAGMNEIFNAMPLPPPTTGSNEKLIREQSFPPPNGFPQGGSPGLRRDQSFPPPVQPGLSIDLLEGPVNDWAGRHMAPPDTVNDGGDLAGIGLMGGGGLGGGGGGGGGRSGRSGERVRGGSTRNSSEFHNNFGGGTLQVGQQNNSGSNEQVKWEHLDSSEGSGVSRVVGGGRGGCNSSNSGDDDDSIFLDAPSRPLQHTRRPSFDKLAAMIPDIPVRWPSPSSSPAAASAVEQLIDSDHRPNFDKTSRSALVTPTLDPTQPARGRPCNRPGRPRRTLDDDLLRGGIGGSARQGRKLGGKRGDAPLSCGPASREGGPVDLARQARRTAKIERYMYKRSRRKFANSTRDASPSRSRPKAARVRPREKGKFVKTVPDFIPVTAVATDNFVEMDMKHTAHYGVGGMRAAGIGLGNGMGMRVGGGGGRGGAAKHGEAAKRPMVRLGPSSEAWRNALLKCPGTGAIVPPVHGAAIDGVDRFYCPPSPM